MLEEMEIWSGRSCWQIARTVDITVHRRQRPPGTATVASSPLCPSFFSIPIGRQRDHHQAAAQVRAQHVHRSPSRRSCVRNVAVVAG